MASSNDADLFETPDVPRTGPVVADRRVLVSDTDGGDGGESIESGSLAPDATRARFAHASELAADYSGSIASLKNNKASPVRRVGTLSSASEFTVLQRSERKFESPLERYHRLNAEVAAFLHDLQLVEHEKPSFPADQGVAISEIVSETERLSRLLQGVSVAAASPAFGVAPAGAHSIGAERVLAALRSAAGASAAGAGANSGGTTDGEADKAITYELYYKQSGDSSVDNDNNNKQLPSDESGSSSKLVSFERRLARIEKALSDDGSGSSNATHVVPGGLLSAVSELERKLSLLDVTRMALLQQQLAQLHGLDEHDEATATDANDATTTSATIDRRKQLKVNQLYELLQKWDGVATQVPTIAARLHALKDVHQQSSTFVVELQRLEEEQSAILKLLETNGLQLQNVPTNQPTNRTLEREREREWIAHTSLVCTYDTQFEQSFQQNLALISQNTQGLSQRLQRIHEHLSNNAAAVKADSGTTDNTSF